VAQINQATNINVGDNYNHKQKLKKQRESRRKNTREFVYLVRSNTDIL